MTEAGPESGGLQALDEEQCWRLLASHGLGRLGVTIDDEPQIFPASYVAGDGRIALWTAVAAARAIRPGSRSCFQLDGFVGLTGTAWSVVAHGLISELPESEVGERRFRVLPPRPGTHPRWLSIAVDRVAGQYFHGEPLAPVVPS